MCTQSVTDDIVKLVVENGTLYKRPTDHYTKMQYGIDQVTCDYCKQVCKENCYGWRHYDVCSKCVDYVINCVKRRQSDPIPISPRLPTARPMTPTPFTSPCTSPTDNQNGFLH